MKHYQATHIKDPDIWETRQGGRWLVALGLPFLFLGVFAVSGALGIVELDAPVPRHVLFFAGLMFFTAGMILAFGRNGLTIDRKRRKITRWVGLLVPIKREEFMTDSIEHVSISREIRGGAGGIVAVYMVRLKGPGYPIEIEELADLSTARRTAEELAGFLNKPLEDSSTGTPVVTMPEELPGPEEAGFTADEAEPVEPGGSIYDPPAWMRSNISFDGAETVIDTPARGLDAPGYLSLAIGTVVPAVLMRWAVVPLLFEPSGYLPAGVLTAVMTVAAFVTWTGVWREARRTFRVSVSPLGISVEESDPFKAKVSSIPANEIREIYLAPEHETDEVGPEEVFGHITVTGDWMVLRFGRGLSYGELKYLQTVVKRALRGRGLVA